MAQHSKFQNGCYNTLASSLNMMEFPLPSYVIHMNLTLTSFWNIPSTQAWRLSGMCIHGDVQESANIYPSAPFGPCGPLTNLTVILKVCQQEV